MTLQTRFILIYGVGSAFFLIMFAFLVFNRLETSMVNQLQQQFKADAKRELIGLQQNFSKTTERFRLSAEIPIFRTMRFNQLTLNDAAWRNNVRQLELYFLELQQNHPEIWTIRYLDPKGFEVLRVEKSSIAQDLADLSHEHDVRKVLELAHGEVSVTVSRNEDNEVNELIWWASVFASRNVSSGVLGFHVSFDSFCNRIVSMGGWKPKNISIEDGEGGILFSTGSVEPYGSSADTKWKVSDTLGLPGLPWRMIISADPTSFFADVNRLRWQVFLIILPVIILLSLVTIIFTSRRITGNIRKLVKATEMIGNGNLDYRIDVKTNDEIGRLAVSFNQMVERLKVSEKKSRAWLENSPICTKIVDHDSNLQYMSAMGIKSLKIDDITQFYGKPYPFDFYPESFRNVMTENLEKVRETGEIITQEASVVDTEGTELWFHSTLVPVNDDEGRIDYIIIVSIDTTERKQIENERNTKSSFLQLHQMAAVSSNEAKEIEDAFVPILKGVCSHTGWPIGHVYVVSDYDKDLLEPTAIWNNEDFGNLQRFCEITKVTKFKKGRGLPGRVMASGKSHWIKDVTKDHDFIRKQTAKELGVKTGFACPVMIETEVVAVLEFFSTEVIEPDNQLMEVVSDVGIQLGRVFERKRIEEEHIKMQKLESVGILAGGIAHDFNNSLQAILGIISVAKLHINPEDEVYDKLTDAEKIAMQSKSLSQQLLTLSRGGQPIKRAISASALIKESASFALSGSNVGCELDLPDCRCFVEADKGQMNQVFNNLFINADQAMPKGGVVNVKAECINIEAKDLLPLKEGKYVKIAIKDQGTGIPKENLQKIFDPYFTTKQKGSGLGLAITYSIIKKHGGLIMVESEVGVGTTFYIYLPTSGEKKSIERILSKVEVSRPVTAKGNGAEKTTLSCKKKILFMDDEDLIRLAISQHLRNLKYEVATARDGFEAIELYKSASESGKPFNAIVLDLTIPGGMGGKETIIELLKIDPDVKAIIASGYSNDPVMTNYKENGFKGVVEKPYEIDGLNELLQKVIMEKQT